MYSNFVQLLDNNMYVHQRQTVPIYESCIRQSNGFVEGTVSAVILKHFDVDLI